MIAPNENSSLWFPRLLIFLIENLCLNRPILSQTLRSNIKWLGNHLGGSCAILVGGSVKGASTNATAIRNRLAEASRLPDNWSETRGEPSFLPLAATGISGFNVLFLTIGFAYWWR